MEGDVITSEQFDITGLQSRLGHVKRATENYLDRKYCLGIDDDKTLRHIVNWRSSEGGKRIQGK